MSTPTAAVPSAGSITGLFNDDGRLVPVEGDRVYSQHDRRYFKLLQPSIDFGVVHDNVARFIGIADLEAVISRSSFEADCEQMRAEVLRNPLISGLFSGVHVPFLLVPSTYRVDLGEELDTQLLGGVERSFRASWPGFDFRNYLHERVIGQLSVVPRVRYDRLVAAHGSRVVSGWYFPVAMAGYAIPDQRGLVARVPEPLILSGPLEAAMALIGAPGLLMHRESYPNLLALAAVQPRDPRFFHFFEAYGWNLTYNQRSMIGPVSEYFAGGFTIFR